MVGRHIVSNLMKIQHSLERENVLHLNAWHWGELETSSLREDQLIVRQYIGFIRFRPFELYGMLLLCDTDQLSVHVDVESLIHARRGLVDQKGVGFNHTSYQ
jgi:hypothetical protein